MLSALGLAWDGGVTEGGSRYTCQGVGLGSGVTVVSSPPVTLWVLPRPLQVAREGRETGSRSPKARQVTVWLLSVLGKSVTLRSPLTFLNVPPQPCHGGAEGTHHDNSG